MRREDQGARTCKVEYVWSDCDCGATVPDSGVTGGMGGAGGMMAGGMGGTMAGGVGGMSGGMGGTMAGGMGGTMSGDDGGMSGGVGGRDPVDAGDDSGQPMSTGYVGCTVASAATDCGADAECRESDPPFFGGEPLYVCAAPCSAPTDCPEAPAGGMATVACTEGHCVLTCSTNILMLIECPTDMTCASAGGDEFCYDDGN